VYTQSVAKMQPQQQTVVTTPGVVEPTNISQPYLTTSVVNSYSHRQSTIIGILLIILGELGIVFNIVDLAVGANPYNTYHYYYAYFDNLSNHSNGVAGHGFWCGAVVSSQLSI